MLWPLRNKLAFTYLSAAIRAVRDASYQSYLIQQAKVRLHGWVPHERKGYQTPRVNRCNAAEKSMADVEQQESHGSWHSLFNGTPRVIRACQNDDWKVFKCLLRARQSIQDQYFLTSLRHKKKISKAPTYCYLPSQKK